MRSLCLFFLFMSTTLLASGTLLERPLVCDSPGEEVLQYDDGLAWWLDWAGTYRGTWFHAIDFFGYPAYPDLSQAELWFYHHSSHNWDVSNFHCEIWEGGASGPALLAETTSMAAAHYAAVFAVYPEPGISVPADFWIVVNTEMSTGGWPSILGDGTPQNTFGDHSFFSDDFEEWEPWLKQGAHASDYFLRAHCFEVPLEETTWASIKGLFD